MKKQTLIAFLFIALLSSLFLDTAIAAGDAFPPPPQPPADLQSGTAPMQYSPSDKELIPDLCPPVENLVRNASTQQWAAPNGWGTTAPSFLRAVDKFVGAQWVGISIGEIICVYTKTGRSTFPVTLQRRSQVPVPRRQGSAWSEDKGGYMECKSDDIRQCPFMVQIPQKQKNVYEQLDFYKGQPVESY